MPSLSSEVVRRASDFCHGMHTVIIKLTGFYKSKFLHIFPLQTMSSFRVGAISSPSLKIQILPQSMSVEWMNKWQHQWNISNIIQENINSCWCRGRGKQRDYLWDIVQGPEEGSWLQLDWHQFCIPSLSLMTVSPWPTYLTS